MAIQNNDRCPSILNVTFFISFYFTVRLPGFVAYSLTICVLIIILRRFFAIKKKWNEKEYEIIKE